MSRHLPPLLLLAAALLPAPALALPGRACRVRATLSAPRSSPMEQPTDVVIDRAGRRYVLDGVNGRIVVFDRNGAYTGTLGRPGSGPGELRMPVGLGIARDKGELWVADTGNARLVVLATDGTLRRTVALARPKSGRRPEPTDVLPRQDRVYVADNENHMVRIHAPDGALLSTFGSRGENVDQFRFPSTVAADPKGGVYVVDVLGGRVLHWQADGTLPREVSSWGVAPGRLFRPKGVAVDPAGDVYVSDSFLGVVSVFDDKGRPLGTLQTADGPLRLRTPTSLAFAPDGRLLHVVETRANRVRVVEVLR